MRADSMTNIFSRGDHTQTAESHDTNGTPNTTLKANQLNNHLTV